MLQDLRFALRLIAKDPWFAGVAVVTLGLGIGLNAAVFTLVNASLVRPLPFPDSGSLYVIAWQDRGGRSTLMSRAELDDLRHRTRSFAGLAGFREEFINISDDRSIPERVSGAWITANTFAVLRQKPLIGRDFTTQDERRGLEPVVILGYRLWKNRYQADPAIIGRTLRLNGRPATIVGVMPDRMRFPTIADLWTPFVPQSVSAEGWRVLTAFARLDSGVSRRKAQADLNVASLTLAATTQRANTRFNRLRLLTFSERFEARDFRAFLLTVSGAVGFVLLIACANVANLLLSRSARRAREVSLRIALGATRSRVIRQLLIESSLLGLIGGIVGLVVAIGGVRLFDAAESGPLKPYWIEFTIDYVVVVYLAAVCVGTVVLFGMAPALQLSRANVNDLIKQGGQGSVGCLRTRGFTGAVVVTEIALTVVLLAGAGLMVRSFAKLYSVDVGYRTDNIMALRLELSSDKYRETDARRAFYDRLALQVQTIPGVEEAALATSVPSGGGAEGRLFEIEGRPVALTESLPETAVVSISPRFFEVLNLPVRVGRAFTERDGLGGIETVLINERLAAQHFPGQNPIGQRIRFTWREPVAGVVPGAWKTVVGVAPTLLHNWPREEPVIYTPHQQDAEPGVMLVVRSRAEPGTTMRAVQREVQALDRDQPVFMAQTIDQMIARRRYTFAVFGSLLVIFAVIGLLMAAVGVYAVMAYSVTQRTQEIGVRMALGADRRQVSWLVVRRGVIQLGIGLAIGLVGAIATTRLVRAMLVQVTPTDPLTFVAITLFLAGVAIAACLIPARRATQIDPLSALREE